MCPVIKFIISQESSFITSHLLYPIECWSDLFLMSLKQGAIQENLLNFSE